MQKEIKVSFTELILLEAKMSNLNKKIQNRKLNIQLVNSKGSMANAIMETANQLQKLKTTLCDLTADMRRLIKSTEISFKDKDISLSKKFY